jgi:type II secretory pathway component PulC
MERFSVLLTGFTFAAMLMWTQSWAADNLNLAVLTSTEYQLVGTVEGSEDFTFAVFENPQTKHQRIYKIGDEINGAIIIKISHQTVLLKHGDKFLTVQITGGSAVEEKPKSSISTEIEKVSPKQALEHALSKQIPPYSAAVQKTAVGDGTVNRLSGELQRYTDKPSLFTDTSFGKGIRAADLGGEVAGRLGLDANDVIVGISGMGIDTPERLSQIIEILNRAKVFNLSVIHDSNAVSMSYEKENDHQ